jgi:hypothetical protein
MPRGVKEPREVRFWRFIQMGEGCWEWLGTRVGKQRRARFEGIMASRFIWELVVGPIPPGLWVLHRCDNPGCVNPEHLFLGTRADNMRDAHLKGRINMRKVSRAGTLAHYPHLRTND